MKRFQYPTKNNARTYFTYVKKETYNVLGNETYNVRTLVYIFINR